MCPVLARGPEDGGTGREAGEFPSVPRSATHSAAGALPADALRPARARREACAGPWLPEPVVADAPADQDRLTARPLTTR